MKKSVRLLKRGFVAIVGTMIVVAGIVMIFLPGPGMVVIPAGLAVLATEFPWARSLLAQVKERFGKIVKGFRKQAAAGNKRDG